jgi:spore germination protein KB
MKIQITNGMLTSLVMTMVYSKALGVTQGIMAREIDGDIWLSTILSTIQGTVFMAITVWVIQKTPGHNLISQARILLGPVFEKLVGVAVFVFFSGAFCTILMTYTYHILDYFLPDIPILGFVIVGLIVSLYGIYQGLEVIARAAFLGVLCMLVFNILMIFGSVKQMDVKEMLPLFQSGFLPTLWASRHNDTDWAMATLMVSIILPNVSNPEQWKRSATFGVFFGGIIVLLWPIMEITVISPEMTAQYFISCMQMARTAQIGVFLQRYELVMVALFIVPLFVQLMMCLYCSAVVFSQISSIKDLRYTLATVTVLMGGLGYWVVADHMRAIDFVEKWWPPIALPLAFGLPVLIGGIGWLRKKKLAAAAQ